MTRATAICRSPNRNAASPPACADGLRLLRMGIVAALLSHVAWAADPVAKSETPAAKTEAKSDAAPAPAKAPPEIPKSIFLLSSATQAFKDPFFPISARVPTVVTATVKGTNAPAAVAADLSLKAIFGTPARPLATINNVTFAVGEEHEISTALGRVRVRCVAIKLQDETVIVEVAGSQRELRFPRRK